MENVTIDQIDQVIDQTGSDRMTGLRRVLAALQSYIGPDVADGEVIRLVREASAIADELAQERSERH